MRMGAWGSQLRGRRGGVQPLARLKEVRKPRARRVELEGLETRALLSTIPAATATSGPQDIGALMGNSGGNNASANSAVVAVDPQDPSKLVSVWIENDPTMAAITNSQSTARKATRIRVRVSSFIPVRCSCLTRQ